MAAHLPKLVLNHGELLACRMHAGRSEMGGAVSRRVATGLSVVKVTASATGVDEPKFQPRAKFECRQKSKSVSVAQLGGDHIVHGLQK